MIRLTGILVGILLAASIRCTVSGLSLLKRRTKTVFEGGGGGEGGSFWFSSIQKCLPSLSSPLAINDFKKNSLIQKETFQCGRAGSGLEL